MSDETRRQIIQEATGAIPMWTPTVAPTWQPRRFAGLVVFLVVLTTVLAFAIGRGVGVDTPRQAEVAPVVVPSTVSIVTSTPPPGVILYSSILAATPDTRIHHGYSLMCKGEVREYAGLDALRAAVPGVLTDLGKKSGKVYGEADCKCIAPYYEGEGYRECSLH